MLNAFCQEPDPWDTNQLKQAILQALNESQANKMISHDHAEHELVTKKPAITVAWKHYHQKKRRREEEQVVV
ncbi:hypothetical protein [Sporisorium scitamineum]|uniref:Uncharacterized protein n=1 Tax=Sporisorium scitamineum TaxID=49012 RepID=A0A0F7SDW3_9BASI|nr:hypothetical protein [Sporisorium scitamineum]